MHGSKYDGQWVETECMRDEKLRRRYVIISGYIVDHRETCSQHPFHIQSLLTALGVVWDHGGGLYAVLLQAIERLCMYIGPPRKACKLLASQGRYDWGVDC